MIRTIKTLHWCRCDSLKNTTHLSMDGGRFHIPRQNATDIIWKLIEKNKDVGLLPRIDTKCTFYGDINDAKIDIDKVLESIKHFFVILYGEKLGDIMIEKNESKNRYHVRIPSIIVTKEKLKKMWYLMNKHIFHDSLFNLSAESLRYPFFNKWDPTHNQFVPYTKYIPLLNVDRKSYLNDCHIHIDNAIPETPFLIDIDDAIYNVMGSNNKGTHIYIYVYHILYIIYYILYIIYQVKVVNKVQHNQMLIKVM